MDSPAGSASGYDSTNAGSGYDSPLPNGEKKKRVANAPFRRIKVEDATYHDERMRDNSFSARVSNFAY